MAGNQVVGGGHHQQGNQSRQRQSEENHCTHRHPALVARPHGEHQRHRADNGGERGHQDWAQTAHRACDDRLLEPFAALAQLVDELDDQDAVLGHHADQHDHADLAVDAHLLPRQPEAEQAAEDAERHRHHHHGRGEGALELGHQHQIDHQQGEAKDHRHLPLIVAVILGVTGVIDRHAARQMLVGPAVEEVERLAQSVIRRHVGGQGHRLLALVVVEAIGGCHLLHRRQGREAHHLAIGRFQVNATEIRDAVELLLVGTQVDVILLAPVHIGGLAHPAQHRLQSAGDGGDRNAELAGAVARDGHL